MNQRIGEHRACDGDTTDHRRRRRPRAGHALAAGLVALLSLSGCATGATAGGMTVTNAEIVAPKNPAVERAVTVGEMGGGSSTNPLWTSKVGNEDFKTALTESLRLAGMLADGAGRYTLKASLVSLDQPLVGFDMTVTATVQYSVTDMRTGAVVWQETVATPHTARVAESFLGTTRLRLANEGAVRKNIAQLIERLGGASLQAQGAVSLK